MGFKSDRSNHSQWQSFNSDSRSGIVAYNSAESVLNKCIKFSGIQQGEADYRPGKRNENIQCY